jgi:DNA invertase Pin-like site-specific DNA recombinase
LSKADTACKRLAVIAPLLGQLLDYKLDRLGRETRLILNAVAELEKYGVRVPSMTEEFDTATAHVD